LQTETKNEEILETYFPALSLSSDPPHHSSEVATENKKFVLSTSNRNAEAGVKDEKSQKEPSEMSGD
jgi:hypothetical protein